VGLGERKVRFTRVVSPHTPHSHPCMVLTRTRTGAQSRQAADRDEGGSNGAGRRNNARDRDRDREREHMPNGVTVQTPQNAAAGSSRAHQTHRERERDAFAASQQPLLTSWALPDYLAHLTHILPSETPVPLVVEGIGEERGVKVRWPSKRMSVGDMNKRVRALVEWVGREQASALERGRRRKSIESVLKDNRGQTKASEQAADFGPAPDALVPLPNGNSEAHKMVLDRDSTESPVQEKERDVMVMMAKNDAPSTMKLMEELMEELISFQEKFSRARS
jgi:hypothetical protein